MIDEGIKTNNGMNICSAIKEDEILPFTTTQYAPRRYYTKYNKPEKEKYCMILLLL